MPPVLFFFLMIPLAIHGFCGSMHILGFFPLSVKTTIGILIGIELNLQISLVSMAI